MWKVILYALLQCILLTGGQVLLKFALLRMPPFAWSRAFWGSLLVNWHFAACGLLFGAASLLWMYMMKVFPFSTVYPLVSLSYVFGMLAAMLFFHEEVSAVKWTGVLLIMLGCTLTAQGQSAQQMRQQIQQAAAAMKSMQCDFVQTKHLKMLNEQMVSKGKMYYQQSDKLRWEYVTPYTYTFVLNDTKVLLKNSRRDDVIDVNQNRFFKEIARVMMNSVVGNCLSDDKDFKADLAVAGNEWVATLHPVRKEMRQMFQQVRLHFDKVKKTVTRVELIEKKDDKTIIELKNVRTNVAIPAETFAVR